MANTQENKATRNRYSGPVNIDAITDDRPVQRTIVDNSRFEAMVQASWDKRAQGHQSPATSFTVEKEAASLVESRLRTAAKSLGYGIAVERYEHDHPSVRHIGLTPDKVRIKFEARQKSNRGRRTNSNGNAETVSGTAAPDKAAGAAKKGSR